MLLLVLDTVFVPECCGNGLVPVLLLVCGNDLSDSICEDWLLLEIHIFYYNYEKNKQDFISKKKIKILTITNPSSHSTWLN